jgi:hypothetical protein
MASTGREVKRWHVIFDSHPRISEVANAPVERFDQVATAGQLHGRKIFGMWIIDDEEAEQVDVTRIHGSVPETILRLYHAYHARRTKSDPTGKPPKIKPRR